MSIVVIGKGIVTYTTSQAMIPSQDIVPCTMSQGILICNISKSVVSCTISQGVVMRDNSQGIVHLGYCQSHR